MERKDDEINEQEFDILENMCFSNSFSDILKIVDTDVLACECLVNLLNKGLIQLYYPTPDEEIDFEIKKFQELYKDYDYLATK